MDLSALAPSAPLLLAGVVLDAGLGDPVYRLHPIRLIGATISGCEAMLRRIGFDGRFAGCLLFALVGAVWVGALCALTVVLGAVFHVFVVFSMVAMGDLIKHGNRVDQAAQAGDIERARQAISMIVGRDTARMDAAACRRAAIESLSESLVDGFISPIFWYTLAGVPGIVLFKVISTMDSMVGYKTPRYLQFGWCGARADDAANWIPARLSWLLLSLVSVFAPGCSGKKAIRIGWSQHALVPGPNAGWSEATAAGAIQRRLVGPIWRGGELVTEIWLGDPADPPADDPADYKRAVWVVFFAALGFAGAVLAILA